MVWPPHKGRIEVGQSLLLVPKRQSMVLITHVWMMKTKAKDPTITNSLNGGACVESSHGFFLHKREIVL